MLLFARLKLIITYLFKVFVVIGLTFNFQIAFLCWFIKLPGFWITAILVLNLISESLAVITHIATSTFIKLIYPKCLFTLTQNGTVKVSQIVKSFTK